MQQGLKLIQELTEGNPAVHADHGIGIYEGLQTKSYDGRPKEYLVLRYAAGDMLAVPVEYAHKVTAYVGQTHPPIARLHTSAWAKTKRTARADAVRFAKELLDIASRRAAVQREPYLIDAAAENKLAASFPYELTPDQAKAWQEVQHDLQQPEAMDRLVVGDVGFGKTEIAIRAAYHGAAAGKQVAVLAPTTLLVQQHADTFRQRLPELADRIGVLSRFSPEKERKKIRSLIADGQLNIIIGTHALLSEKVTWHNLGLAIIDEEQRFGVKHKEHFKEIRARLDILSLSATPIPRTLSMALSGLKQLSIISSPPVGRKSIITYVGHESDARIAEALEQELKRHGQVYVVAPRVRALPALAHRIQQLAPRASIGVAHGQLPERELAAVTASFDQGQLDILVSSSIIENGLDLPAANTIIVMHATTFGLGDLYQLRGRVGRRQRQGYAYFLYNHSELTSVQRQRLVALTETARLGSGWNLAQRDLEIRGAGNLLGAEQSGSVNAIGVQLYLDMVRDAAASDHTLVDRRAVDIELPLPALIPPHYLAEQTARARAYQALARAATPAELKQERDNIEQKFGPFPAEALNLFLILQLQHAAAAAGITAVTSRIITPPRQSHFARLTVHTARVPKVAAALSPLGTWRVQENTLSLDIASVTSALVQKIISLLC